MRHSLFVAIVLAGSVSVPALPAPQSAEAVTPQSVTSLFNGKNLAGWRVEIGPLPQPAR